MGYEPMELTEGDWSTIRAALATEYRTLHAKAKRAKTNKSGWAMLLADVTMLYDRVRKAHPPTGTKETP
jgi:hypothetical protein